MVLDAHTYEYWLDYHDRLDAFMDYYKKSISKPAHYEKNIDFCYDTEFYSEKVASLYGELDRVKTIMSILRYKYETDQI